MLVVEFDEFVLFVDKKLIVHIIYQLLKFYNLNLQLKLEYVFIIPYFEELATWFEFDLNFLLHSPLNKKPPFFN
jgi:hypothetical protein